MINRTRTITIFSVPNLIDAEFWGDVDKFAKKWDLEWSVGEWKGRWEK